MNICSVKTEEWHSKRMKCEASVRHSDGYFLEVKPIERSLHVAGCWEVVFHIPMITGIPPMRQKLSKKPMSAVTSYDSLVSKQAIQTTSRDHSPR